MSTNQDSLIEETYGKIVFKFPILTFCDEKTECIGFIVEKENERFVLLTKNGVPYISSANELEIKSATYAKANSDIKKAITLLSKYQN
jgi:hypothetical protein